MTHERSKEFAHSVLAKELGFTVEPLPSKNKRTRTADLYVKGASSTYLVEATEKLPTPFFRNLCRRADATGSATDTRGLGTFRPVDDSLRNKADQLRRTKPTADFSIVFLACFHDEEAGSIRELTERTVYGAVELSCLSPTLDAVEVRKCFYFDPSTFADEPSVAGVLFASRTGGILFANSRGDRADAFQACDLYSRFAERRALVDPDTCIDGTAQLSLPVGAENWSAPEKLQHIRTRFGLLASPMQSSQSLGLVNVRLP